MTRMNEIKDEVIVRVMRAADSRLRAQEVQQTVSDGFGISLSAVREAIRDLVEEGELSYLHYGPDDYLEIPPIQTHHAARPMNVIFDSRGEPWICDADVNAAADLVEQGCWRCGDLPFTRND